MQGTLTILNVDGTRSVHEYTGPVPYDDLNHAVGGWIEFVPQFDSFEGKPARAIVNEEGRVLDLPLNPEGTKLWKAFYPADADLWYEPQVFGPLAILTGDDDFLGDL